MYNLNRHSTFHRSGPQPPPLMPTVSPLFMLTKAKSAGTSSATPPVHESHVFNAPQRPSSTAGVFLNLPQQSTYTTQSSLPSQDGTTRSLNSAPGYVQFNSVRQVQRSSMSSTMGMGGEVSQTLYHQDLRPPQRTMYSNNGAVGLQQQPAVGFTRPLRSVPSLVQLNSTRLPPPGSLRRGDLPLIRETIGASDNINQRRYPPSGASRITQASAQLILPPMAPRRNPKSADYADFGTTQRMSLNANYVPRADIPLDQRLSVPSGHETATMVPTPSIPKSRVRRTQTSYTPGSQNAMPVIQQTQPKLTATDFYQKKPAKWLRSMGSQEMQSGEGFLDDDECLSSEHRIINQVLRDQGITVEW